MHLDALKQVKAYYDSGATKSYAFRKQQLLLLKKAIKEQEQAIMQALFSDLKKSPEESYATEIGLVLQEINYTLKHLKTWMQPEPVPTDLVNFPSSSKIYKDPLGVVLIIAPWNYPFQLLMTPLIGAIAGGNCMVVKPSEHAPATAAFIIDFCKQIFASNYVLTVHEDGATCIPAMMKIFRFDHVFYTGSTHVGRSIYQLAAEKLVPVTLELGGKSPTIVDATASLKVAAQRIVVGKLVNAGQTCIAPDYVLVQQQVKDALIEALKKAITAFYGTYVSSSYDYGKIINERQFDRLVGYLKDGEILFGGDYDRTKLYIAPTLLQVTSLEVAIMQEEIFGPILPILSYKTNEEALAMVKQNENPLALYIFSNNKATQNFWMEQVAFGGGCINNADWHFTNHHLPFGGVGQSGVGAYHGKYSFDVFTRKKGVLQTPNWFNPRIKYPTFKNKLKLFKWMFR
jgi:aldehyde dehydrogenase (NAD+)